MRWEPGALLFSFTLIALLALSQNAYAEACGPQGTPCLVGSQCCSNLCSGNVCGAVPCLQNGQPCALPNQCCSYYCNSGSNMCASPPSTAGGWADSLFTWVGLAVIISALFLALAYMAAKAFEAQILEAWVKIEINELVASFIIAVFCVGLIVSANSAAGFLIAAPSSANVGNMALGSIAEIYGDGAFIYSMLSEAYFDIARIASYSYTIGVNLYYVSTSRSSSPGAGLSPLVADIGGAMDAVANSMLFLSAQNSFVIFFINAAQIMLPVGIFLRSFSMTRRIGGAVLAAVIVSSVVYPASFAISGEVYRTYAQDLRATANNIKVPVSPNPPLTDVICNPAMQFMIESPLGAAVGAAGGAVGGVGGSAISTAGSILFGGENGWSLLICMPLQICPFPCVPYSTCEQIVEKNYVFAKAGFSLAMWPVLGNNAPDFELKSDSAGTIQGDGSEYYNPIKGYALPAVSKYAVLVLVFSLIPIIVSIVVMRNFAVLFGGDTHFYGLSKLI